MMKKLKQILSILITTLIVAMACLFVIPRVIGINPTVVLSGSMEPTYPVGSLIFVGKTSFEDIKVNDNVTFYMSGSTAVTHRVVEVNQDKILTTKGDNNNTVDGDKVSKEQIVGKASQFAIPFLGYIAVFLQSPVGYAMVIALVIVMILMSFLEKNSGKEKKNAL